MVALPRLFLQIRGLEPHEAMSHSHQNHGCHEKKKGGGSRVSKRQGSVKSDCLGSRRLPAEDCNRGIEVLSETSCRCARLKSRRCFSFQCSDCTGGIIRIAECLSALHRCRTLATIPTPQARRHGRVTRTRRSPWQDPCCIYSLQWTRSRLTSSSPTNRMGFARCTTYGGVSSVLLTRMASR